MCGELVVVVGYKRETGKTRRNRRTPTRVSATSPPRSPHQHFIQSRSSTAFLHLLLGSNRCVPSPTTAPLSISQKKRQNIYGLSEPDSHKSTLHLISESEREKERRTPDELGRNAEWWLFFTNRRLQPTRFPPLSISGPKSLEPTKTTKVLTSSHSEKAESSPYHPSAEAV